MKSRRSRPPAFHDREIRDFAYVAMDVLHGILISGFVDREDDRTMRRWRRACVSLREIAPALSRP